MLESERKKLLQHWPYALMREKNRIEALKSFGISEKNIQKFDKNIEKICKNFRKSDSKNICNF